MTTSVPSVPTVDVENNVMNIDKWLDENKNFFKPPICNKLMYGGQLKVMFVGGPNVRRDFHIDCGEEFFYQMKGNISLPIYEKGIRKEIHIKEGQVFLLPGNMPHSPQRPEEGSIGLVVERERIRPEMDAMRFYTKDNKQALWEKWFYCSDLGKQLGPIVAQFKDTEEFKTDKPLENSICKNPPVKLDTTTMVKLPFNLLDYINNEKNKNLLNCDKVLNIFESKQTTVNIFTGPFEYTCRYKSEIWYYVMSGNCSLSFDDVFNDKKRNNIKSLNKSDSCIVNTNCQHSLNILDNNSIIMSVSISAPKGGNTGIEHGSILQENLRIYYQFDGWPKSKVINCNNFIGFYTDPNTLIRTIQFDDSLKVNICSDLNEEKLQFEQLRVGTKDFNDKKVNWKLLDLNNENDINYLPLSYDIDGWSTIHLWFKTKGMIEKTGAKPYPETTNIN